MDHADVANLMKSLFVLAIQGGLSVLIIVVAVLNARRFRAHWRVGLAIGIVCLLLALPGVVFGLLHFRMPAQPAGPNLPKEFMGFAVAMGMVIGLMILVMKVGWHMVVYCAAAAEWERLSRGGFPLLQRRGPAPWRGMIVAAVLGIMGGGLSTAVFVALDVERSQVLEMLQRLFPGADAAPALVRLPVALLAFTVPAIVEELVFRGAVLGFFLRAARGRRGLVVAAFVVVSLLWAAIHLMNTAAPLVKCTQIFVIGLAFCELARRWCVEAAIVGHISLNVTAAVLAFVIPGVMQ